MGLKTRSFQVALSVAGVEAVCGGIAIAGPWVQDRGAAYQSASVGNDDGDFGEAWRQDVYVEYGLTPDWTVVTKEEAIWRDPDRITKAQRTGFQVGARRRLAQAGGFIASAEAAILFGDALEGPQCAGTGLEARISGGYGGEFSKDRSWYIATSTAWRERGGCQRVREEIVVGVELDPVWTATLKSYGEWGDGAESLKVEALLGRRFGNIELSAGYHAELSGAFEESGYVVHVARRL